MKQVELMVTASGYILVDVPDDKMSEFEAAMSGLPAAVPLDRLPASVDYDPEDLVNDLEFAVVDYDVIDDGGEAAGVPIDDGGEAAEVPIDDDED